MIKGIQEVSVQIKERLSEIDKTAAVFKKTILSPDMEKKYEDFVAKKKIFDVVVDKAIVLAQANKMQKLMH